MMPAIQQYPAPRALVIEDDPLLQLIHRNLLEKMGFDVTLVVDADGAIKRWGEHWDLIFSDIGLPGIDGMELCKKRREYEKSLGIYTPAFAYTAYGSTVKDACLQAGFDAFGVKPMDHREMFASLQALLPEFKLVSLKG